LGSIDIADSEWLVQYALRNSPILAFI
jgi:hypothetical protein